MLPDQLNPRIVCPEFLDEEGLCPNCDMHIVLSDEDIVVYRMGWKEPQDEDDTMTIGYVAFCSLYCLTDSLEPHGTA